MEFKASSLQPQKYAIKSISRLLKPVLMFVKLSVWFSIIPWRHRNEHKDQRFPNQSLPVSKGMAFSVHCIGGYMGQKLNPSASYCSS